MMDCSFLWVNRTLVEINKIPHGNGLVYYVIEAGFIGEEWEKKQKCKEK